MTVTQADSEVSAARFPGPNSNVEECWMDFDGARMRYLRAGSGPPLILLHGLMAYSFSWRFTIPALAPYATVYVPDMPGAGFSDAPTGLDCTMHATAKRLLRFIARLGISSFDLVGTSHGGAVAMMAAAEYASTNTGPRLQRLVLVAPVNPYSAHGQLLAPFFGSPIGSLLFRFGVVRVTALHPYWLGRLFGDPKKIPADSLEGYALPMKTRNSFEHALSIVRTWTADLRELQSILPKLSGIPTLLVWGAKDPAVYASSAAPLAKYFPNSKTIIFPGIGHLPYEECPEQFNRTLIEFLTRGVPA